MIESRGAGIAAIQTSWLNQGEIVLRYEQLIENGSEILRDAFIGRLALPIAESALTRAIRSAPAERGRRTGAVDWRKHFTPKIRERFAEKFGQVLIDTGYEKDLAWAREPSSTHSQAGL
jgi:lipopolysaccharide transport system ATP-binding protein